MKRITSTILLFMLSLWLPATSAEAASIRNQVTPVTRTITAPEHVSDREVSRGSYRSGLSLQTTKSLLIASVGYSSVGGVILLIDAMIGMVGAGLLAIRIFFLKRQRFVYFGNWNRPH